MNKSEAIMLAANHKLNVLMRERQAKGIACETCGGDGLKQHRNDWVKCPPCGGTGLK